MVQLEIAESRRNILLSLGVLGVITAVILMPFLFGVEAGRKTSGKGLFTIGRSHEDDLPNYDIRTDKTAFEKLAVYRNSLNRSASEVADRRDDLVRGEAALRSSVPTLKIEYSPEMRTPEVIAPDASMGPAFLARPTAKKKSQALKSFLNENKALIGGTEEQIDGLKVFADYTNPDGNLRFVELEQEINGIHVFRGAIKAAYTKNGELIRVINNFAAGLDYANLSGDFGDPNTALSAAAGLINYELNSADKLLDAERSTGLKAHFGQGDWAPTAEKIYFPTEPGIAVPAWRVLIWKPTNAYYVIVDAHSGQMLWRKNITEDQTQHSTFEVYTNPNAMINVADSPSPTAPTVFDPGSGTQGLPIFRTNVMRIGNEAPYTFNNNGWINDAVNITDGNAVESGLDLVSPDGNETGTHALGSPYRNFSSTWNPPPGIPAPGDAPGDEQARRGAVIQQFYLMNWYHDELYRLGFTEQARNFQTNNFGRGGVGNDRISAEGQDFGSKNNANFATPADGGRGKMQMYVFDGPTPDRDGTVDAEILIHEATHGTSNRLHANAEGLSSNMARAMGEGWSDFYAHCLTSEPGDPLNGTNPLSGYLLLNGFGSVGTGNYYYGIRRFPKAIMSATGGPQNRPFNPLTFADIDQTKINTSDGAFPAMFGAHISTNADQAHAAGEVWSSALWEFRTRMVQRLGWATGNRKALQLVTDAMKVSPINPTFLQGRDAIVSVAIGSATTTAQLEDAADVWAGFAIRGMGVDASIQVQGGSGAGQTRVTESFDKPNLMQLPTFTITDIGGDADGIAEPGEPIVLNVPLTNIFGTSATTVTANIPGASSSMYGTIPNASTVTRQFNYTVPAGTQCGALITLTMNVNSSLGAKSFALPIPIGIKNVSLQQNFDGVTAPTLPAGWTQSTSDAGIAFVTSGTASDTAPNAAFGASPNAMGSSEITSPAISVNSAAATVSFRNQFNLETGFDGGVLEISVNGGGFQDIIAAGGSFLENGYTGTINPATNSPIAGRQAWTGASSGFVTSTAQLPASTNGQSVRLRWRHGSDASVAGTGWFIDTVVVRASSSCSSVPNVVRSRADYDGDGKTDLSIFRPSEGNWYIAQSLGGITVLTWGVSTDTPTPGDFDGDGRADFAIFRPTPGNSPDFYIVRSAGFVFSSVAWGDPGDKPVIGDYDGDGKDDIAVYRESNTTWYTVKSSGGLETVQYGQAGDVAVPGKFDGDAKTDRAVYRSGQWIVEQTTGGTMTANWGEPGDILVPADYDGDGKDDVAVWRPSNGFWYIRRSTNFALNVFSWGQTGDIPAPGDFDGDGRDDPTVWRNGTWYVVRSTQGIWQAGWGVPGDVPIPRKYLP
ncbi:MAG: M36 family metallopeptidase [Pyrinomonadaceae bacterium]